MNVELINHIKAARTEGLLTDTQARALLSELLLPAQTEFYEQVASDAFGG